MKDYSKVELEKGIEANSGMGEIILYQPDNSVRLEVRVEDETVWLSQAQMGELFDKDKRTISEHIGNIFKDGELDKISVVRNFRTTAPDGKTYDTNYYNLDVIISVGYRVKSLRGTAFRRWATKTLKQYILKDFAINQRFERIEQRVTETEKKIDFFVKTALPPSAEWRLQNEIIQLKRYIEIVLSDYNDINEDTRMQLELINEALAKLQSDRKLINQPRNPIGFRNT